MCVNTLRHEGAWHLQKREKGSVTDPVNKGESGRRQARKTVGTRSRKALVEHAKDLEHHPMKPLKDFKENKGKICT